MRKISLILALIFALNPLTFYGQVDYLVFNTIPRQTFAGAMGANNIISASNFVDTAGHWAAESIAHAAALGIINFGGPNFMPNANVTFQEAAAFAVNLIGEGEEVISEGMELSETVITTGTLQDILHLGFLTLAQDNDLITEDYLAALLGTSQEELTELQERLEELTESLLAATTEAAENLLLEEIDEILEQIYLPTRGMPISRQAMAMLVARALDNESDHLELPLLPRGILTYNDWQTIDPYYVTYVEAVTQLGLMSPIAGNFAPNNPVTRAEMAQILRNLDHIFYEMHDMERHAGTVAAVRANQEIGTLQGETWDNFYIRRHDGDVDIIQHRIAFVPTGALVDYNVPVFRNGQMVGLGGLEINDVIEYITREDGDGQVVLYINVVSIGQNIQHVLGRFMDINAVEGTLRVRDDLNRDFIYSITSGLFGMDDEGAYLYMDYRRVNFNDMPFGAIVELTLINSIVAGVSFIGQPVLVSEVRGIVVENNPAFGYLTLWTSAGGTPATFFYNQNDMRVLREGFYQTSGGPGYIAQMFPYFMFHPTAAHIADLMPGDIVFIRLDENNPTLITSISAAANYVSRFGVVRQVNVAGGVTGILMQMENGTTSWFDIGPNIMVTTMGRPANAGQIQVGDSLRILVNQAVIAQGHTIESVLEVAIQAHGQNVSTILTGHLAGINSLQSQLMLQNSRPLTGLGWGAHQQIEPLNLVRQNNVEFFHEGNRITLDHANRFLARSELDTYIAMDSSPFGDTIARITFRNGRDELLNPDTVISTNGAGGFIIPSISGTINTDSGTIVRRNGRLVTGTDIMVNDLVRVSLNGGNNAAVVDIIERPAFAAVGIARARILSVSEGRSFRVQSMSTLQGTDWMFTPIEREFTIGPNTLFLNEDGFVDPATFMGFTDESVINEVFTVVYDGAFATHVIDAPFGNRSVRGRVFGADGDTIRITDAQYLDNSPTQPTFLWRNISHIDPTMNIATFPNTIIVRNNQIVQPRDLQNGDRIRVLTHNLPTMASGVTVPGYIIVVEGL